MIYPAMGLGIKELSSPSWAHGGAWDQNEGKTQSEGEARDRAEGEIWERSSVNPHKDFGNSNLKLYNLAIVE